MAGLDLERFHLGRKDGPQRRRRRRRAKKSGVRGNGWIASLFLQGVKWVKDPEAVRWDMPLAHLMLLARQEDYVVNPNGINLFDQEIMETPEKNSRK